MKHNTKKTLYISGGKKLVSYSCVMPYEEFKLGWHVLQSLYRSQQGHCLKNGCGKETLQYYANNHSVRYNRSYNWKFHDRPAYFWRNVLREAVNRGWVVEDRNNAGCRKYKFLK